MTLDSIRAGHLTVYLVCLEVVKYLKSTPVGCDVSAKIVDAVFPRGNFCLGQKHNGVLYNTVVVHNL